ncbi:nucleotide disphospho-sugar-binding domain-containing protein [Streptomyces sp. NPDC003032]
MRVLFTVSNWGGHYFCMVPLGWALQAAGHDVRVACPPAQAGAVREAGLIPVPVLESPDLTYWARLTRYQEAVEGRSPLPGLPPHPVTGRPLKDLAEFDAAGAAARFWAEMPGVIERSYDAAVAFGRAWRPDLVVHDLLAPEGALVARLAGVPAVYHSLGLFGAAETEHGVDLGLEDPTGSFARHGAEPWDRTQISHVIDPSPDGALPPHGTALRLPVRYVPYNGPGASPPWLHEPAAGPRICVLWGYSATAMYGPHVPAFGHAVRAAAAHAAEVVLTASEEQVASLGPLPSHVRVLREFPLHLLLPTCDMIIHHGGASAFMTAAAAGVPQLSLTLSDEWEVFGARMAGTGAAVVLSGLTADGAEIDRATAAMLSDADRREAAARIKEENAARPTPADLVAELEELAEAGHELRVGV